MKNLIYLFCILFVTNSCVKEIEFSYNNVNSQVVVNSLFTPQEPWVVYLTYSKANGDSTETYIENASVTIESEDGTISLEYEGEGKYTSDSYPEENTTYTITADVPGYDVVTATSSVPSMPEVELQPFDTVSYLYLFSGSLSDMEVMPISFNFNNTEEQYFRLCFESYWIKYRYYITQEAIDYMRKKDVPEDIIAVFEGLIGQYFTSSNFALSYILEFYDEYGQSCYNYYSIIKKKVIGEKIQEYDADSFNAVETLSNCDWLENISYYTFSVIGIGGNMPTADIYLSDSGLFLRLQEGYTSKFEYWLNVETCSPEYYKYYKTYVLQVSQRGNSYADAVEVYSNIENGLGIFAGYNVQKVYILQN